MALASALITSARYDLRDPYSTQYADAELLEYINRGIRALDSALGMLDSDWVYATSDLSLTTGTNSVTLPTDFSTDISVWVGVDELAKTTPQDITYRRACKANYIVDDDARTYVLTDDEKYILSTHAGDIDHTVPKNSSVAFAIGDWIEVEQGGAGTITFSPVDGDVTITGTLVTTGQFTANRITKTGTNTWVGSVITAKGKSRPDYYSITGTTMNFDKYADTTYTATLRYNKQTATLTATSDTVPYNGEFDDTLRQFMILSAKSREEYDVMSDAAMFDFFMEAATSKVVSRDYIPNIYATDF